MAVRIKFGTATREHEVPGDDVRFSENRRPPQPRQIVVIGPPGTAILVPDIQSGEYAQVLVSWSRGCEFFPRALLTVHPGGDGVKFILVVDEIM